MSAGSSGPPCDAITDATRRSSWTGTWCWRSPAPTPPPTRPSSPPPSTRGKPWTGAAHAPIVANSGATDANILRTRGLPTARVGMDRIGPDAPLPLDFPAGMNIVDIREAVRLTRCLVHTAVSRCTRERATAWRARARRRGVAHHADEHPLGRGRPPRRPRTTSATASRTAATRWRRPSPTRWSCWAPTTSAACSGSTSCRRSPSASARCSAPASTAPRPDRCRSTPSSPGRRRRAGGRRVRSRLLARLTGRPRDHRTPCSTCCPRWTCRSCRSWSTCFAPPLPSLRRCARPRRRDRRDAARRRASPGGSPWSPPAGSRTGCRGRSGSPPSPTTTVPRRGVARGPRLWGDFEVRRREIIRAAKPDIAAGFDAGCSTCWRPARSPALDRTSADIVADAGNGAQEIRAWIAMAAALAGPRPPTGARSPTRRCPSGSPAWASSS